MAKSGIITGTTSNQSIDVKVDWESVENVTANTSVVTAYLKYRRTNTGYTTYGTGSFSITIDGQKSMKTDEVSIGESWVTVMSFKKTVTHNSTGSKSFTISATGSIPGTTLTSTTLSQSVTLDTIPRATTVSSLACSTIYFNGQLTCRYSPKSPSYYNRCNISLNLDGDFIAVKTINLGKKPAFTQQQSVSLSESELATIYNKIPKDVVGTLRFTFRTYSDSGYSTQIGDAQYKEITLYIPETNDTKPTVTMTLSAVNSLGDPFSSLYIQGKSKVKATFSNGEGKYGATDLKYSMRIGVKTYGSPYTSGYILSSGSVTVTGVVSDSRGFKREYTKTVSFLPYEAPKILPASNEDEIICARCDEDGNLTDSGTYLKIKAKRSYSSITVNGEQNNFCSIRYRHKEESATSFSAWKTILGKTTLASNTADTNPLSNVVSSIDTAYVVQVGVVDDMGNSDAVQFTIPTDFVTIDIPESHKGRRIGVGRYAEDTDEPGIDMGMPIHGGSVDNLTLGEKITASTQAHISLDDIKTPGNYYSPNADNSQYIEDSPYTAGGFSLIVREIQSANMIRQELFYGRTNWQRHYNSAEDTWSDWLRYLMTDYPETTAADFVTDIGVWNIDDNDTDKGYWRYRKWKSGAVDMNGVFKVVPTTDTAQGTTKGYWSQSIDIDLPFSVVNFQFTGSSAVYFIFFANANMNGDNKIRFRLFRFADFAELDGKDVYIRIIASGKLK